MTTSTDTIARRTLVATLVSLVCLATALPGLAAGSHTKTADHRQTVLLFQDAPLPFNKTIEIPKGVKKISVTTRSGLDISMVNADSGRPRCYLPSLIQWGGGGAGPTTTCAGLTALDAPGTKWRATVGGEGTADIKIAFSRGSKDIGPAKKLDLDRLSMPRFRKTPTEDLFVESFDGTALHVQVTRPDTAEPVPAVLISSPYNVDEPDVYYGDLVNDWVPRGYAVVVADVRGYNQSGGCVEVWSANEQKDQNALVEWIADQDWSDGRVGMFGKSYVGTTPLEAAVQAPPALKAIAVVAPVVTAYKDWHFGGVPNGENALSPAAYQGVYGTSPEGPDPAQQVVNAGNGFCDPSLAARASDPRAIYDDFYIERDFAAQAKNIDAAVLYTHGYEDSNVKSAVYTEFFNALKVPHLGIFGHWAHDWAPRADMEVLFLAWMDQYVKGVDIGLERLPNALVLDQNLEERRLESWPPTNADERRFHIDGAGAALVDKPVDADTQVILEPIGMSGAEFAVEATQKLKKEMELAGVAKLKIRGTLAAVENGFVSAQLYDGDRLVTFGMANLAHRNGHDTYAPVTPGEQIEMDLEFIPTDHAFGAGSDLRLVIHGVNPNDWSGIQPTEPGVLTLSGGKDGAVLTLPTLR